MGRSLKLAFLALSLCALFFLAALMPFFGFAQELRLVEGDTAIDPALYRAYYGKLVGEPHLFTFSIEEESPVSFVILVPDREGATTDITAALTETSTPGSPLLLANGSLVEWSRFFDTAGRDSYLAGPTLAASLPRGAYEVRISSVANEASYVLVVSGEKPFSLSEMIRRYATLPVIKSEFFGKPTYQAYLTPLLLRPILGVLMFVGLIIFGYIVYRRVRTVE